MSERVLNFIDNEFLESKSGQSLALENPATCEIFGQVVNSKQDDLELAINAAEKAYPKWAAMPFQERAAIFRKIASILRSKIDDFAFAESKNSGKLLKTAKEVEIPRSIANLEFFAESFAQWNSEFHQSNSTTFNYTLRKALGVVACISPWNLPLYLFTWKIAPALIAGNTVVAKPSEVTPLTAQMFAKVCLEAGLPKGVLNIVNGEGQRFGQALCTHPKIKAISFTGSTRTGSQLAQWSAPHFKKLSLEMGGKNPAIVFADCDFDKTVTEVLRSSFSNQGQICLCTSRLLIEKPIYEKFKKALVEKAQALKVGDPLDATSDLGSLVSKAHFEKVSSHVDLAQSEGGKILCGGKRSRGLKGYFFDATLIEALGPQSRTNQEEIFGPLVTLQCFDNETEALQLANASRYGLAATVFTSNLSRAHRMAGMIESGMVWINTWMHRDLRVPFGGTKESGLGREGGTEALNFFTESQNICVQL